ncbi:MTRF1L release factor glutamine methyltransferase-like [Dipodomys merriami]|uniref:MTRF1L release factor glutamine methyltransferase-like n=1 Tax=Dipodomys merriami TaxID=94247 RepID=UPI003855F448
MWWTILAGPRERTGVTLSQPFSSQQTHSHLHGELSATELVSCWTEMVEKTGIPEALECSKYIVAHTLRVKTVKCCGTRSGRNAECEQRTESNRLFMQATGREPLRSVCKAPGLGRDECRPPHGLRRIEREFPEQMVGGPTGYGDTPAVGCPDSANPVNGSSDSASTSTVYQSLQKLGGESQAFAFLCSQPHQLQAEHDKAKSLQSGEDPPLPRGDLDTLSALGTPGPDYQQPSNVFHWDMEQLAPEILSGLTPGAHSQVLRTTCQLNLPQDGVFTLTHS